MKQTIPKPYQKKVLFFCMVLVRYGFGLEPNQNHTKTITNGYVYARTHVMSTMVLYAIFLELNLIGN